MIEEIGRHVAQKVNFATPTRYTRHGTPRHATASIHEESVTTGGLFQTAAQMKLKPGEMMAVWEVNPDEHRTFAQLQNELPPTPSHLLVQSADGKLLELNPTYISINNRPEGYVEFTDTEREELGLR